MQTQLIYLFSLTGYEIESVTDTSKNHWTCANNNQKVGKTVQRTNLANCRKLCDEEETCNFMFFNEKNGCHLYSKCQKLRTAGNAGATYKKGIYFIPPQQDRYCNSSNNDLNKKIQLQHKFQIKE